MDLGCESRVVNGRPAKANYQVRCLDGIERRTAGSEMESGGSSYLAYGSIGKKDNDSEHQI